MRYPAVVVQILTATILIGCAELGISQKDTEPDVPPGATETKSTPDNYNRYVALQSQIGEHLRALEKALKGEEKDPQWSRIVTSHIDSTLSKASQGGGKIDRIRCGTNLCQIRVIHGSMPAMAEYAKLAQTDRFAPWSIEANGAFGSVVKDNGRMLSVLYVARPQKALPLPLPENLARYHHDETNP